VSEKVKWAVADISARLTDRALLVAVKGLHTLIWFLVEASVGYLVYAGLRKRKGRDVTVAASIVVAESVVFLANGASCPLTPLAESLGAESGSVTDIYLPKWLAHYLPVIHVPLLALIVYLHRDRFRSLKPRAVSV
jgi:hypothetical protein